MIVLKDKRCHYVAMFNSETGQSIRSNVLDENGNDTGIDPFRGSFPELLDIGVMGHCAHGLSGLCLQSGVQCYQDGLHVREPNMPLEDFKGIIDQCAGKTFQVALGGRGDPDMHDDFVEMIRYAREKHVVPNFTTSGYGLRSDLLPAIKQYCGAVAVSWYRNEYTQRALSMFLSAGIKTNIHFCLSRTTIDEAIELMEGKRYPDGVNRVIFLLHKPVGLGKHENVLHAGDPRVRRFFSIIDQRENAEKSGFDSCSIPAVLNFTRNLHPMCIEPCEAGRFSAYISPDFRLFPCSFEKDRTLSISLRDTPIEEAWNSGVVEAFRRRHEGKCAGCPEFANCLGGCPIVPEITLCNSAFRTA